MRIIKMHELKHSGHGSNATHIKVIDEFNKAESLGRAYCAHKGFDVNMSGALLTISQRGEYGFKLVATFTNKETKSKN